MKLKHPNFIHYMNEVQIKDQFYKKRKFKFIDNYVFQVAFISVLFLLFKIGSEAMIEAWVK